LRVIYLASTVPGVGSSGRRGGVRSGAGRPPKPPSEKQTEKFMVTFTRRERVQLETAAGYEPVATFIRRLVLGSLVRSKRGRRGKRE
jgi:hypothetical protein